MGQFGEHRLFTPFLLLWKLELCFVKVNEGENITYKNISISAVSTSKNPAKNTDGWDIYRSNNVVIQDSTINNGDDCVSFKPSEYSSSCEPGYRGLNVCLDATNIIVSNLNCNGSQYAKLILCTSTNLGADYSMAVAYLSDRLVNTRENMTLLRMLSHRKSMIALQLIHR